jgi:hypothetical protein
MSGEAKERGIKILNFLDSKTLVMLLVLGTWYARGWTARIEATERIASSQGQALSNLVDTTASLKVSVQELERRMAAQENRH